VNHGANGDLPPAQQGRYHLSYAAWYFLSRGYAVALPMMRGYAGSGGRYPAHGCNAALTGLDNAKDMRAVIQYMASQPYIDGSRVVISGQSFGGWNTLAAGSLNIPNVKALVNFSGGVIESDCHDAPRALIDGAAAFGAKTSIPSVWFYGTNDKLFAPSTWRDMYARYTGAGGKAQLVDYGFFGEDAHQMLASAGGLKIWTPRVDALLQSVGLPATPVNTGYLPPPPPPPSHYAAIDDDASVPYLNDVGRAAYGRFLAKPMPRAFVLTPNGSVDFYSGGYDPSAEVLQSCAKRTQNCTLYAVDDQVVWIHPAPAPAPTRFAALDDAAAVPYINAASRERYKGYLAMRKPKALVIAPDGGWNASSRGPDPLAAAMAACSAKHQNCRFYAVDDNVVWTPN
jgi:dienelactone hydrolase